MDAKADRLHQLWWARLPAAAMRHSAALAGVLMDGRYLAAWPPSAWMPPALLLLGVFTGWLHPGFAGQEVYTASLLVMSLAVAVGQISSAWGAWLWLGYVLGDFWLYGHSAYAAFHGDLAGQLVRARLPLLLPYIFLALALTLLPLTARSLAGRRGVPSSPWLAAPVQALLQGALVYVWTQAVPTLIRPVYTWAGGTPTVEVMRPLQHDGWVLAVFAALLIVARVLAERRAATSPAVERASAALKRMLAARPAEPRPLPGWASVALKTGFTTFLLAGVLAGWPDALLLAAALAAMLVGRERLRRHLGGWARLLAKVPLAARLAVGVAVNFFVTRAIVTSMWYATSSFRPILLSVLVSLLVFLVLMPDAGAPRAPRSAPAPPPVRSA